MFECKAEFFNRSVVKGAFVTECGKSICVCPTCEDEIVAPPRVMWRLPLGASGHGARLVAAKAYRVSWTANCFTPKCS